MTVLQGPEPFVVQGSESHFFYWEPTDRPLPRLHIMPDQRALTVAWRIDEPYQATLAASDELHFDLTWCVVGTLPVSRTMKRTEATVIVQGLTGSITMQVAAMFAEDESCFCVIDEATRVSRPIDITFHTLAVSFNVQGFVLQEQHYELQPTSRIDVFTADGQESNRRVLPSGPIWLDCPGSSIEIGDQPNLSWSPTAYSMHGLDITTISSHVDPQIHANTQQVTYTATDSHSRTSECRFNLHKKPTSSPVVVQAMPTRQADTVREIIRETVPLSKIALGPRTSQVTIRVKLPAEKYAFVLPEEDLTRHFTVSLELSLVDCAGSALGQLEDGETLSGLLRFSNATLVKTSKAVPMEAPVILSTGTHQLLFRASLQLPSSSVLFSHIDIFLDLPGDFTCLKSSNSSELRLQYPLSSVKTPSQGLLRAQPRPSELICPQDMFVPVSLRCSSKQVTWQLPTLVEPLDNFRLDCNHEPGEMFEVARNPYVIRYRLLVDDLPMATCSFNVFVADTSPPSVFCKDPEPVYTRPGTSTAMITLEANAHDNCDFPQAIYKSITPEIGMSTEKLCFTDQGGHTDCCVMSVFVVDSEAPVFEDCPRDAITATAFVDGTATNVYYNITATDNSGQVTVKSTHEVGAPVRVGTTSVLYTATDPSGNRAYCHFEIVVLPAIAAPTEELGGKSKKSYLELFVVFLAVSLVLFILLSLKVNQRRKKGSKGRKRAPSADEITHTTTRWRSETVSEMASEVAEHSGSPHFDFTPLLQEYKAKKLFISQDHTVIHPTELSRGSVEKICAIGDGQFGCVFKAFFSQTHSNVRFLTAVKEATNQSTSADLINEAAIMVQQSLGSLLAHQMFRLNSTTLTLFPLLGLSQSKSLLWYNEQLETNY